MERKNLEESTAKRKNDNISTGTIASGSKIPRLHDNGSENYIACSTADLGFNISAADLFDESNLEEHINLSPSSESDCEQQKTEEYGDVVSVIGMQYGIIKNIMSFLPIKDLKNLSRVCQLWNAASKAEQRSLSRILFVKPFSWEPPPEVSRDQKSWRQQQSNLNHQMDSTSLGMNRFSRNIVLDSKIESIENSPFQIDVQSQMKNMIDNIMIEPSLAIIFSVGDVDVGEEPLAVSKVVDRKAFHLDLVHVQNILPPKCEVISTCSRGIVIQTTDSKQLTIKEIENNGPRIHPAVTALFLPSFESQATSTNENMNNRTIKIIPFDIPEYANFVHEKTDILYAINGQKLENFENTEMKDREIRRQLMKQVFCRNRLKDDDNIKCIITLSNVNENPSLLKLFTAAAADWTSHHNLNSNINIDPTVERKLSPSLAIGGVVGKLCQYSKGTGPTSLKEMLEEYDSWERSNQEYDDDEDGEDIHTGDQDSSYKRSVGLIFAGDGIEAASVRLPITIRNESKVLKELQRLKDCKNLGDLDDPNSNSFAFMFACCGRGKHFYKEKSNVESKCFRALFPHTPIIGIFGEGEFGWNYLPKGNDLLDKNLSEKEPVINNQRFKELREDDICHSYTTVFVLLSINSGNPKEDAKAAANILQFANSSKQ